MATFLRGTIVVTGSTSMAACASDGDITVEGIRPETLGNFLSHFGQVWGGFELVRANAIRFFRREALRPAIIETDVYPGFSTDWQQPFAILLSHTVLAALVAPLALFTAYQGLRNQLVRHVKVARWTLPIWLYVSITGVIVYWMLYHLYPSP